MQNTYRNLRAGLTAGLISFVASCAYAAPLSFDFKDPKGVNSIAFHLDAPLESIAGTGTGVTGTIAFDPAAPEATTGKIVLATSSLTVGNSMMQEHILGPKWLNAQANPEITFEAVKLSNVKKTDKGVSADVLGKLTLNGVTKEITAPVTFTHLPDKLGARVGKPDLKGDLLVVRSTFTISRSEFDIQPGKNLDKVSDEVTLSLSLAGSAPKS